MSSTCVPLKPEVFSSVAKRASVSNHQLPEEIFTITQDSGEVTSRRSFRVFPGFDKDESVSVSFLF